MQFWSHDLPFWLQKHILFHCNNQAVIAVCEKGTRKWPHIMSLVRALLFTVATHNFYLCIVHIRGTNKCIADYLTCLSLQAFRLLTPAADLSPSPVITPARCSVLTFLLPVPASSPLCLCSHPSLLCGFTFTLQSSTPPLGCTWRLSGYCT